MALSKPLPGALIDRCLPYAGSFLGAWALNEGGGQRVSDSVGRVAAAYGIASNLNWRNGDPSFNGSTSLIEVNALKLTVQATSKFSNLVVFRTTSAGTHYLATSFSAGVSSGVMFLALQAGGVLSAAIFDAAQANGYYVLSAGGFHDGKLHAALMTFNGSNSGAGFALYVDGKRISLTPATSGSGNPGSLGNSFFRLGSGAGGSPFPYSGVMSGAALWGAQLDDRFARYITASPWQLWPDDLSEAYELYVPVVASSLGLATGATTPSASATLTTAIPLVASGAAAPSASATLSTSIALAGTAAASPSALATLSTSIALAGTGLAAPGGSAALSTAVALQGSGLATPGASASLSTAIQLVGTGTATPSGLASLSTGTQSLQGTGAATPSATVSLSTSIALQASAQALPSGTVTLQTAIELVGTGAATPSAIGTLIAGRVSLVGEGAASPSAVATLTTSISMAGSAQATPGAVADLATQIALVGTGVARPWATGRLYVIAGSFTANERTHPIRAEVRDWQVPAEQRAYIVQAQDRTHPVPPETRTWAVPEENRTATA